MDTDIQHQIESSELKLTSYRYCSDELYIYTLSKQTGPNVDMIIKIINIVRKIADKNFSVKLVVLYGEHKKLLEKEGETICPKHANSGATYVRNIIYIWRREEFYKVLIHELVHYFMLDHAFHVVRPEMLPYSYKGDDNIHEVMVDTLVKMGVTTAEELDTLFKQLEGNVSDDAVATAISSEVSKAGFETKSGGLSGMSALGGSGSGIAGAGSSGVGGSGSGGAESSGVGGLQTSAGSELALNNISSSLTTQTVLLEDIKKAVSPKPTDKAKAKENAKH